MKWMGLAAVAFAVVAMAGAAQAGPREDVLGGAIRCGGAGNDRQWLDCYYGAAQPMRAQLRLAPAPQQNMPAQGGALSALRQDVLSGAIRCGSVADDRQWLDCYYGSAQPLRAALNLSPAPQSQLALAGRLAPGPVPPTQAAYVPPPVPAAYAPPSGYVLQKVTPKAQEFPGFWDGLFGDDPVAVQSQLESYSLNKDGFFTATLANGQVWRETSGTATAYWPKKPATYHVEISKGMMRTYNFRITGDRSTYKVKRIR
jgi:hypothetical protein